MNVVSNDIVTLVNRNQNAGYNAAQNKSYENDDKTSYSDNKNVDSKSDNKQSDNTDRASHKRQAQSADRDNNSSQNDDFAAHLFNSIEPGQNYASLFGDTQTEINGQDSSFSLFGGIVHVQTQDQIDLSKAGLSNDTLQNLQAIISDLTEQGLIPDDVNTSQFIQNLENSSFDTVQTNDGFTLVNDSNQEIKLDSAVLFENTDGTVEAAFIQDGKVYTAPLAEIIDASSGLSIEKVLSATQTIKNILQQEGYVQPTEDKTVHIQTVSKAASENANTQNGLNKDGQFTFFEDGIEAPDYEWRSSTKSSVLATGPAASAVQNSQNALAQAALGAAVRTQILIPSNAQNGSATLVGIGSLDWSQVLNADLDNAGNFDSFNFQGNDFIENSLDPDQLIKSDTALKDQSFSQALSSSNTKASSAQSNARPAPASQQVMMNVQKGAEGKLDKITLQLDPIELGKVDIEFDFSEDGKTKAIILAEKPETLQTLKQDARTIETLLSDAGLELGDSGLEFDLKSGGFDQHNQEQNKSFFASNGDDFDVFSGDELELNPWNSQHNIIASSEAVISADRVNILV